MMYRLSASFRLLLLLLTSISTASHEVTVESTKSFKVNAKVPGITRSLAFPPWDWFRPQSIVCVLGAGESVRVSIHQQLIRVEGYFVLKLILFSISPHPPHPHPLPHTHTANMEKPRLISLLSTGVDGITLLKSRSTCYGSHRPWTHRKGKPLCLVMIGFYFLIL